MGNVKNFSSHDKGRTLQILRDELESLGYCVFNHVLNTSTYTAIPQNRERVWIFATLNSNFDFTYKISPQKEKLKFRVKDFVDNNIDENLYKTKKQIDRLIELHNVDFNINETLCFDVYNKKIKTDGICPTITEPHHNSLRIVEPPQNGEYKVRKVSISEQFRLMGFKENEVDFANQSYTQLGNRCGNGWDVNLVGKIFKKIFKQAGF